MNHPQSVHTIAISGSFRRYYAKILERISEFEGCGFRVTSPRKSRILDPGAEFVILESDLGSSPRDIEQKHLDAIYEADAVYVVNPGGYLGRTTVLEIGWALAFGKPIFYSERCEEELFTSYGRVAQTAAEVRNELESRTQHLHNTICRRTPVDLLQKYVHKAVIKRGFDQETPRDILLLMVEEVGELAKAVRKFSGLKVDLKKTSTRGNIEEEMADVFIYLLDLANSCDVDLFAAFLRKEVENDKRSWVAQKVALESRDELPGSCNK